MDDYLDEKDEKSTGPDRRTAEQIIDERTGLIDFDSLLRLYPIEEAAEKILESSYHINDLMRKDSIDRFVDFLFFKVQTGFMDNPNMAYPTRRMMDKELEAKVIEIINEHLFPEIVLKILKFFTRNINDPDSNLYLANLIYSDDLITSIFETYKLIKKDIFKTNPDERCLNVKRVQQFTARSANELSSPLDAAARLKYILEFFATKMDVSHLYSTEDLMLSKSQN